MMFDFVGFSRGFVSFSFSPVIIGFKGIFSQVFGAWCSFLDDFCSASLR